MKIFNVSQIRDLDQSSIKNEPIESIDLMERASQSFVNWLHSTFPDLKPPIVIFCGSGNNGGDGLAVARLLATNTDQITVYYCKIGATPSVDNWTNYNRLKEFPKIPIHTLEVGSTLPVIPKDAIIIDALFGSGLNRPVMGYWSSLILHINKHPNKKIAIDIPSGTFADQHTSNISVEVDYTFSFELPKLAFLFPENNFRVGTWVVKSIGLDKAHISSTFTPNFYLDQSMIQKMLKPRDKFAHKGTFGKALLLVGSAGMFGAAILAAKACLKSGVGLLTVHVPSMGFIPLQTAIPEAMISLDIHPTFLSRGIDLRPFTAVGIGCGIGTHKITQRFLEQILQSSNAPMVLDADALNIIAQQNNLIHHIPKHSILTPHPKEFERLFGKTKNHFERNQLQRDKARALELVIILKGAHTAIALPDGTCYFNSTGNPGMATAGMGDALTGIICSLLAQSYSPMEAALIGVYIHGLAGDIGAQITGTISLVASDLINNLGKAFKSI